MIMSFISNRCNYLYLPPNSSGLIIFIASILFHSAMQTKFMTGIGLQQRYKNYYLYCYLPQNKCLFQLLLSLPASSPVPVATNVTSNQDNQVRWRHLDIQF